MLHFDFGYDVTSFFFFASGTLSFCNVIHGHVKRKRRRSDQVLWQNPLYQQKILNLRILLLVNVVRSSSVVGIMCKWQMACVFNVHIFPQFPACIWVTGINPLWHLILKCNSEDNQFTFDFRTYPNAIYIIFFYLFRRALTLALRLSEVPSPLVVRIKRRKGRLNPTKK